MQGIFTAQVAIVVSRPGKLPGKLCIIAKEEAARFVEEAENYAANSRHVTGSKMWSALLTIQKQRNIYRHQNTPTHPMGGTLQHVEYGDS